VESRNLQKPSGELCHVIRFRGAGAEEIGEEHMPQHIGWLWILVFFGLLAAADAQTASPPTAGTQFDGTYAFVSRTKVNETYAVPRSNRIGRCGGSGRGNHRRPLTIASGQAQYTTADGLQYEGTVSSQGELAMRSATPAAGGGWAGVGDERTIFGKIDGGGTARARQIDYFCSHDLIWQK
jgi:hypothetical protein